MSCASFAQFPNTHTQSNSHTKEVFFGAINPQKGFINSRYPDTASANLDYVAGEKGIQIIVGNTVWVRDSTATRWILNGSTGSAINNGLLSIGGITLVDSTVTLQHDIVWSINGSTFTRTTDTSFVVHTADSGYYRRDLIYADNEGVIHLLEGIQDTSRAITPPLPSNSIQITTVDVYGEDIPTPIPTVIGKIPNLQQVTDAGDTTTNPIILLNNTTQSAYQVFTDANRGNYLYYQNKNSGGWAGSGFLFKNDYPGATPNDEHSGHFLQLYMGSTTNDLVPDGGLIRTNTDNGIGISNDSGHIYFMQGFPFSAAAWDTMMQIDKGILELPHYKNTGDSVLTTDEFGKVRLTASIAGITQTQLDDTASAIRSDFPVAEGVSWGDITGSIPDQTDLLDSLNNKVNKTDRFPINVVKPIRAIDSVTIGVDSVYLRDTSLNLAGGTTGQVLKKNSSTNGDWSWQDESGGTTIDTTSLSNRIDAKQDALTLTTTGTSGAATLSGSILNIPQYSGGSGGSSSGVDSTNTATTADQTVFTFPYTLTDYTVSKQVTRNGVLIDPSDYTVNTGNITFTGFSCDSGDKIRFIGVK
jgi:hypothetical protein